MPAVSTYFVSCFYLLSAYIYNVTPMHALENITPEEAWSGNKPDISNTRVFGSLAFIHIPESQCGRLSAHLLICTFLGFACQRKAYRLVHQQRGSSNLVMLFSTRCGGLFSTR